MAAAAESASVFLETSLGTRLVVSFPASTTTVADLKRRVADEHAECFPQTGRIAVDSMQVRLDGSLFHLTDSVAVESAFRWVQGPWYILVEARELRSHPPARKDVGCRSSDDCEQNSGNRVISHSRQNLPPPDLSQGGGNHAVVDGVSETPLPNQLKMPHQDAKHASNQIEYENNVDNPHQDVERVSNQIEVNNTMPVNPAIGDGVIDTPLLNQLHIPHQDVKHASNHIEGGTDAPLMAEQDQSREGVKKHTSGQPEDGNVNTPQGSSDINLTAGGSAPRVKNQLDKSYESVNPALGQCQEGPVKTIPEESTDLDFVESERETSKMNQLDKSPEDVRASGQLEDGIEEVVPQKSSGVNESAADKDNDPMQGQQKDAIAEPRGMEFFGKENKNDESIIQNCDGNISSTINFNLAEEKSSGTGQENSNSNPLPNQGNCLHDMRKKPSHGQKGPWTSEVCNSESSSSVSDIPPSKDGDSFPNTEVGASRSDEEEPRVAGLCSGERSFKEPDLPHCIKSMEEGNKMPDSNDQFIRKRKYEDATASIRTEPGSCSKPKQRFLCVRKMPMRKAAKKYGLRY